MKNESTECSFGTDNTTWHITHDNIIDLDLMGLLQEILTQIKQTEEVVIPWDG